MEYALVTVFFCHNTTLYQCKCLDLNLMRWEGNCFAGQSWSYVISFQFAFGHLPIWSPSGCDIKFLVFIHNIVCMCQAGKVLFLSIIQIKILSQIFFECLYVYLNSIDLEYVMHYFLQDIETHLGIDLNKCKKQYQIIQVRF